MRVDKLKKIKKGVLASAREKDPGKKEKVSFSSLTVLNFF